MANPDDTYERLRSLEAWISNLYKDAEDDLRGKWDAFMEKHEAAAGNLKAKVATAATAEEKKQAEERYQAYLRSATAGNRYYREMIAETAKQFALVNQRAVEIVNGERSSFYSGGYNLSAGEINDVAVKQGVGIRFDMCSAEAVDWLAENRGRINLPPPKTLNYTEDERWSAKLLNSQVAQGIVQGESIPKIAGRISNVTGAEQASAIRAARTMATECQNAGRVQAMTTAEKMGVLTRKRWVCTHDDRTRNNHLLLDGETIDHDGVFWNGCRFPGDHLGPPEEVWNCRCTLVTVVDGFKSMLPKGKEDTITVSIDGKEVYKKKESAAASSGFDLVRKLRTAKPAADMTSDELKAVGKAFYESQEYQEAIRSAFGDVDINDQIREMQRIHSLSEEAAEKFRKSSYKDEESRLQWIKYSQEYFKLQHDLESKIPALKNITSELILKARNEKNGADYIRSVLESHLLKGEKSDAEAVKRAMNAIINAYGKLPLSWAQQSVQTGAITIRSTGENFVRSYYLGRSDKTGMIRLEGKEGVQLHEAAIHELAHRLSDVMGIYLEEARYYAIRTEGEELVSLGEGFDDYEKTRKDNFVDPYMGKTNKSFIHPDEPNYELLSMGFEGVIGYNDSVMLTEDEDMRDWITGILLTY